MGKEQEKNIEAQTKGFLYYLKKLLTWERVTGIATIITLIVAIIAIVPESETEKLKNEIRQKITIVEKDFNPEELIQESDSSTYVKYLVEFQQKVLEFCTLWQIMDNPRPYVDYSYLKKEEIDSLIAIDMRRVDRIENVWEEANQINKNILDYTSKIGTDNYPFLSLSKMTLMGKYQEQKEDLEEKTMKVFLPKLNKYANSNGKEKEEYLESALEELDVFKNSPEYYRVDNISLEYWIETNKLLKVWKRDVLKSEREARNNMIDM